MAHIYPVKIIAIMLCGEDNLNLSAFQNDTTDRLSRILKCGEQAQCRLFEFGGRHLLKPARRAGMPRGGPLTPVPETPLALQRIASTLRLRR